MCKIKFNDFKITLYDCKNGHKKENISLEEFNKIQYIDEGKVTEKRKSIGGGEKDFEYYSYLLFFLLNVFYFF